MPVLYRSLFTRIDLKKEKLDACRPLTPGETARLRDEFMIEFTYNSNAIEGNTLTLQETALVLEGITIDQKPLKDHLEVVGHRDAFVYVQQLVGNKVPLEERIIKEIHSLVLMDRPEDKGVYRRIPVRIMGAAHEPSQPYMIPKKMEQLIEDCNKKRGTMHPLERIAWFHLIFEGIHPFIDGNGRTGRLIMNFDMMQNGYPPVNIKFTDRKRYYDAFDDYYQDGNADSMVLMIGQYVEERLDRYLEILSK
ncbi:filamentation induced by cAMP protein Fic [Syntrophobotulus glycolicus DSM 8271]|uniref:Filamentation induced by cAMP protein Fic n=1 Tax=Syntrophobotulus glycolicus (strain DSM 8271 / FlGlyR) TaxID=645991 RepID=F0SVJ4_SYNGF|nr:filamentation induced by cAMP protein Fic [Syntrophobotulus glycolicus DSM 8271]